MAYKMPPLDRYFPTSPSPSPSPSPSFSLFDAPGVVHRGRWSSLMCCVMAALPFSHQAETFLCASLPSPSSPLHCLLNAAESHTISPCL